MTEPGTDRVRRLPEAHRAVLTALCLSLALVGCGGEFEGDGDAVDSSGPIERTEPVESAEPVDGGAPTDGNETADDDAPSPLPVDSTDWTIGQLSAPADLGPGPPPVPVVTALRTGSHPEYERTTLEFTESTGMPGYRMEYIDRPLHECGSGRQVFPVGDAWLELRLEPAAAHTEAGEPTLDGREVAVDGPLLRRIYRTCDFEAVVTFVLALSAPNPFRVVTLSNPTRIAVDVQR